MPIELLNREGLNSVTRIDYAGRRLTRIGIFYDGSYFTNINNYYTYAHPRRSRLNLGGLHDFVRQQVAEGEGVPLGYCQVVDMHWFRGRLPTAELSDTQLESERVWDEVLMSYGIVTHYLPVPVKAGQPVRERGIDVWFALEALELALLGRFDVVVLVTGDRDYVPLVRKLNALGVRVMLLGWNITYIGNNGLTRVIRAAGVLAREVTHHVRMEEIIGTGVGEEDAAADALFVQRRDRSAGNSHASVSEAQGPEVEVTGRIVNLLAGFGFITPDAGGENIYFHHTELVGADFRDLLVGDPVIYIVSRNDRGPIARRVELLEDEGADMAVSAEST